MPDHSNPNSSSEQQSNSFTSSEYVRLEADLISGVSGDRHPSHKKTILIYCWSHDLLLDISNELKSALEHDIEILITTDNAVAKRLVKSGEVDLLLHGPITSNLMHDPGKEPNNTVPAMGSALILLQSSNEEIIPWINNPDHSMHLTRAISRLNGSRNK
jgi:hypothetical protein